MAGTLAALMLYVGEPQASDWWPIAIPLGFWVVGPAIAPWIIARLRPKPPVILSLLAFLILSSMMAATAYYDAFFTSTSSTAALVLIFVPLYQWGALIVITPIVIIATYVMGTGRS